MASKLIITSVENLGNAISKEVKAHGNMYGVYISLNKTCKSTSDMLRQAGAKTDRLFFIDCVTSEKTQDDVMHIMPSNLPLLESAIAEFIQGIKDEKYVIIDALSTLLIYNDENKVAMFVKGLTDLASRKNVSITAFSPETKGEELLDKIYNFFDDVSGRTPD